MNLKKLDMPPGNGECSLYKSFSDQVARGRSVGVVFCMDSKGRSASYLYSAKTLTPLTEENVVPHVFDVLRRTHIAAEAHGHRPGPFITT